MEILIDLFSVRGNDTSNKIMFLYLYGGGLVLVTLFGIIIEHRTILLLGRIGMQLSNACSFLVYCKVSEIYLLQQLVGSDTIGSERITLEPIVSFPLL